MSLPSTSVFLTGVCVNGSRRAVEAWGWGRLAVEPRRQAPPVFPAAAEPGARPLAGARPPVPSAAPSAAFPPFGLEGGLARLPPAPAGPALACPFPPFALALLPSPLLEFSPPPLPRLLQSLVFPPPVLHLARLAPPRP